MLVLLAVQSFAAPLPSAAEVIAGIDKNMTSDSRSMAVTMTSVNPHRTRSFDMTILGRGEDQAAIEYQSPTRDAGTKMLRVGDELWMYLPSIEKTQKISGHMLRDGMMGTDVSYEDMMAAGDLASVYDATVSAEEDCGTGDGRLCWKLEMVAKDPSVSYPKRTAWVDEQYHVSVRQELYAVSGMLLKTWTMSGIQQFGDRWFPTSMTITDKLQEGTSTTLTFKDVKFGIPTDDETFSTRWLERG
jgi:outer membrane lipoprotein-sorting protein